MKLRQNVSSFLVSSVVHGLILVGLYLIVQNSPLKDELFEVETVLEEPERPIEEFVQPLDTQVEAATTLNTVAGSPSKAVGGANAKPLAKKPKVEVPLDVNPEVKVASLSEALPGDDLLSEDLGEAEVTGEVGAIVDGYDSALDRLSEELIRLLRKDKLLVVWMFDESESMKDDQVEIKGRLKRVYEELRLVEKDEKAVGEKKKLQDVLITAITSYGEKPHKQTKTPTGNPDELMKAIDLIPVDKSGSENLCSSIVTVVKEYQQMAARSKRRLVLVVVSDESGDDGHMVEEAIREAKFAHAPIYVLGRESVFGSLYAHIKWRQPETGHLFYLPIRRGPETPFAEQLQYNGFRRRLDSQMSGFGPYEQVRLCKETNGIFFQLPGEQEGLNDLDNRKNTALNLREYLPDLSERGRYQGHRDQSDFRKAVWDVILLLNPYDRSAKKFLELPDPEQTRERFTTNLAEYGPKVQQRLQQIKSILGVMQLARNRLAQVKDLRDSEPSRRWRANYDLISAQLLWYQVRLFEYGIGLEQFARVGVPQEVQKEPQTQSLADSGKPLRVCHARQTATKAPRRDPRRTASRVRSSHRGFERRARKTSRLPVGTPSGMGTQSQIRRSVSGLLSTAAQTGETRETSQTHPAAETLTGWFRTKAIKSAGPVSRSLWLFSFEGELSDAESINRFRCQSVLVRTVREFWSNDPGSRIQTPRR